MWLLDIHDAIVVPLADRDQTNPMYDAPPGSMPKGHQLVANWSSELTGNEFNIAWAYGWVFVYAKVEFAGMPLYMNVWRGKELDSTGTLYCSIACTHTCEHEERHNVLVSMKCLCGDCRPHWQQRGWICKNLSWGQ